MLVKSHSTPASLNTEDDREETHEEPIVATHRRPNALKRLVFRKEDCPNINFWERRQHEDWKNRRSTEVIREYVEGASSLSYIEHEDGSPISEAEATQIRGTARSVFAQFATDGTAPAKWGQISVISQDFYFRVISERFPYIAMCEDMWKAQLIATTCYPSWYRNNKDKIEKERQDKHWLQLQLEHGRQIKEETLEHVERVHETSKRSRAVPDSTDGTHSRSKKAKANDATAINPFNVSIQHGSSLGRLPAAQTSPATRPPANPQYDASSTVSNHPVSLPPMQLTATALSSVYSQSGTNAIDVASTPIRQSLLQEASPSSHFTPIAHPLEHRLETASPFTSNQNQRSQSASPTPTIRTTSCSRSPEPQSVGEPTASSPLENAPSQRSTLFSVASTEASLGMHGPNGVVGVIRDSSNPTGVLGESNMDPFGIYSPSHPESNAPCPPGAAFAHEASPLAFHASVGGISVTQDVQMSFDIPVSDPAVAHAPPPNSSGSEEYVTVPQLLDNGQPQSHLAFEFENGLGIPNATTPAADLSSFLFVPQEKLDARQLTATRPSDASEQNAPQEAPSFTTEEAVSTASPSQETPSALDGPPTSHVEGWTAEALMSLRDMAPVRPTRPVPRCPDVRAPPLDADTLFDRTVRPIRNPL